MRDNTRDITVAIAVVGAVILFLNVSPVLAMDTSGLVSNSEGLPWEDMMKKTWNSLRNVIAPIMIGIGFLGAVAATLRGNGVAVIGGFIGIGIGGAVALNVGRIFGTFSWDGALV